MANIPVDVVNHILSFLPVKDKYYDSCMDQIVYLASLYNENCDRQHKPTRNYYRKMLCSSFILHEARQKHAVHTYMLKR